MDERTLLSLKKEIENTKQELSELRGKERYLRQQLKEQYDCDSVEDAVVKRDDLATEIKKLDSQIAEGVQELQEKYQLS